MREENQLALKPTGRTGIVNFLRHEVKLSYRGFYLSSLVFLVLPVIIFCLGYLKLGAGVPLAVIFAGIVFLSVMDCRRNSRGQQLADDSDCIRLQVSCIAGLAVTAIVLSYVTGIGEYIYTLQDHSYRRAILRDLVNYDWPVIYNYNTQTNPEVVKIFGMISGERAFSYYFIYWLPAALVGKTAGFAAADFFLLIWNSAGIFLTMTGLMKLAGRQTRIVPFVYIFFAGLDAIPNMINCIAPFDSWVWLQGWVPYLSYVANFTELANVFNQAVPCFLIMTLLLMSENTRSMGLTGGILFAYSPWAVIGLIPIVAVMLFKGDRSGADFKRSVRNILSSVNIFSAVTILFLFGSFYLANSGSLGYRGFTWTFYDNRLMFIPAYIVFIAIEVLPFVLMLYSREKNNPVFLASVLVLLIIPIYRVTEMNDFSMRCSMPGLFVISVCLMKMLAEEVVRDDRTRTRRNWFAAAAVTLAMILMMFPAFVDLYLIIGSQATRGQSNREDIGSFGNINKAQYAEVIQDQFFVENYKETFFFRYLAK